MSVNTAAMNTVASAFLTGHFGAVAGIADGSVVPDAVTAMELSGAVVEVAEKLRDDHISPPMLDGPLISLARLAERQHFQGPEVTAQLRRVLNGFASLSEVHLRQAVAKTSLARNLRGESVSGIHRYIQRQMDVIRGMDRHVTELIQDARGMNIATQRLILYANGEYSHFTPEHLALLLERGKTNRMLNMIVYYLAQNYPELFESANIPDVIRLTEESHNPSILMALIERRPEIFIRLHALAMVAAKKECSEMGIAIDRLAQVRPDLAKPN